MTAGHLFKGAFCTAAFLSASIFPAEAGLIDLPFDPVAPPLKFIGAPRQASAVFFDAARHQAKIYNCRQLSKAITIEVMKQAAPASLYMEVMARGQQAEFERGAAQAHCPVVRT